MLTVPVYEAKTKLSALLDAVAAGEEVMITRHGRPAAKLVKVEAEPSRAKAAAAAIRAMRKRIHLPKGVTLGDLMMQARRC